MTTPGNDKQESGHLPATANEDNQTGAPNRLGGRAILALQGAYDKLLAGRLRQLQSQVIEQDREISRLTRELAQMGVQIEQLNRRLSALEDEASGEAAPAAGDESE